MINRKMGATDKQVDNRNPQGTPGFGYARYFTTVPKGQPGYSSQQSSTTATPGASATTSTSVLPSSRPTTAPPSSSDPQFFARPVSRAKSIIMYKNKPVAVSMRSEKEERPPTPSKPPSKPLPLPLPKPKSPAAAETPRTVRIPAGKEQRNSITLSIGKQAAGKRAERIFESSQIKKMQTYQDWKKEAKALLPSNTGGPAIERLADAINAAPTLQKEKDPKNVLRTIQRLSDDPEAVLGNKLLLPKRRSSQVDYTKVREIKWSENKKKSVVSKGSSSSSGDTVLEIGVENEEELEQARLEFERKQAGIDFKHKLETLRQLSDHLSNKRAVRQQLVKKATGYTVLDAEEIPIKEHILYAIEFLGDLLHDLFTYFFIWEKQIREINGRYGVVTANYFGWLRQMVGLELLALFFVITIIMIPQYVQENMDELDPTLNRPVPQFSVADLIHGEGWFHDSFLYYTGYHRRTEDSPNPFENPAFRFLFCIFIEFIVLTYFIFSRLTRYYHSARLESTVSGVSNLKTIQTVFFGWDYSCRDEQAKVYLHQTIYREMKFLARKHNEGIDVVQFDIEFKKALAFSVKHLGLFWGPWSLHIVGNLIIIVICVILAMILLYLCKLKLHYYLECVSLRDDNIKRVLDDPVLCPKGDEHLYLWVLSLPALFASITMLLLTKLILIVGDIESWSSPERKIYATMLRSGLFYFTNIGVFYLFWLKAKPELNEKGFVAEGIFGKELYRLVVIQGLMEVILNLGLKGIYDYARRKLSPNYQRTEFRTEYCCLSMFFNFSVSRIGVLFCPPLSAFVVLRLIVDFYQNRYILYNMSSREGYSAHVSQVYAPFLLTFFILCYLITSFLNVYYLTDTIPSNYDGPFQIYNVSYDEVLSNVVSAKKGTQWIAKLAQPGFLTALLAILAGLTYFCRDWARAYQPIIVQLNQLILLERADRDLLLKAIFEIGKVTGVEAISGGEGDEEFARIEKKMRRAGIEPKDRQTEDEEETDAEDEFDDETDMQITQLIHRVQRRKSLGYDHAHPSTMRKTQHHHAEQVESMLAKIVETRRRRSHQGAGRHLSLLPPDHPLSIKYNEEMAEKTTESHANKAKPATAVDVNKELNTLVTTATRHVAEVELAHKIKKQ